MLFRCNQQSAICRSKPCARFDQLHTANGGEKHRNKIYMESSPITPLISPMLFTRIYRRFFGALDWQECGIKVYGEYPNNLRFGDIAFMSNSGDELQLIIIELDTLSRRVGLPIWIVHLCKFSLQ